MERDPRRLVNPPTIFEYLICAICHFICSDPVCTPCEHYFCQNHIEVWLQTEKENGERNSSCPTCRGNITNNELPPPSRAIRDLLASFEYSCINCNAALKADQFESHETVCTGQSSQATQELSRSPMNVIYENGVAYANCDPKNKICDEQLASIIAYATSGIEISRDGENVKEVYNNYSEALAKKYPSSIQDPYQRSHTFLSNWTIDLAIEEMKNLVPSYVRDFDDFIKQAIESLNNSITSYKKEEFKVVYVFLSGENLQIIPCYMTVSRIIKQSHSVTIYDELSMTHMSRKLILTKFEIPDIIAEAKARAKARSARSARAKAKAEATAARARAEDSAAIAEYDARKAAAARDEAEAKADIAEAEAREAEAKAKTRAAKRCSIL